MWVVREVEDVHYSGEWIGMQKRRILTRNVSSVLRGDRKIRLQKRRSLFREGCTVVPASLACIPPREY
jgi:hypothetical protein